MNLMNSFHELSFKLIDLAEKGTLISDYLKEISRIILEFSKAKQLNFIVNDIKNYYRFISDSDGNWEVTPAPHFRDVPAFISGNFETTTLEHLERAVYFKYLKASQRLMNSGGLYLPDTSIPFGITAGYGKITNSFEIKLSSDFKSVIVIPIRVRSENIGVISLKWDTVTSLSEEELSLYQYVFDVLGFARSHRQAKFHLGERIKELTTIFQITRLGAEHNKSLDNIMEGVVEIIPPGFLVPEYACCQIVYMNKTFKSRNYTGSKHTLVEEIFVNGEKRGFVEVGYTKEKNSLDKGPFLKEERPMLKTIARELGLIAERKHFEEEKENLQQQLLHADRLVTVGQLTAGVAHELNEPLGGILGFAQLIKKYGEINETTEKDIDKIIKAALHAREIIRKLMLFSRQSPPDKVLFNINERIDDGLYLLENRIKKSSIILIKELQSDLPLIKIDPSQFHQVLVNLVVNAIQAMPEGGTLTIKTENLISNISMTVKDTGTGMTKDQIEKIFIPFYTTKGINEGTGLGLPVVLGIVQAHGGSISVESEHGKWSVFTVKFPVTNGNSGGK